MSASPESAAKYEDILRRIAIVTADDRVLVDRVRNDLAVAGIYLPIGRVADVLA